MIDLITLEDSKKAQVDEIIEQLTDAKQKAAESGDEDKANNCWRDL